MLLGKIPTNNGDFKDHWADSPLRGKSIEVAWQRQLSGGTFPPIRIQLVTQTSRFGGIKQAVFEP